MNTMNASTKKSKVFIEKSKNFKAALQHTDSVNRTAVDH